MPVTAGTRYVFATGLAPHAKIDDVFYCWGKSGATIT